MLKTNELPTKQQIEYALQALVKKDLEAGVRNHLLVHFAGQALMGVMANPNHTGASTTTITELVIAQVRDLVEAIAKEMV